VPSPEIQFASVADRKRGSWVARNNERSVGAFCCKHTAEGMKANPLKVYASLVATRSKGVQTR